MILRLDRDFHEIFAKKHGRIYDILVLDHGRCTHDGQRNNTNRDLAVLSTLFIYPRCT